MNGQTDFAFVVVVMHGAQDVSRITFQAPDDAARYVEEVQRQYPQTMSVTLYHTRLARTDSPRQV